MKKQKPFDKYFYYTQSVQSPKDDVDFFTKVFKKLNKKQPHILREDFCGTFSISLSWVKSHSKNKAIAVDTNPQPLNYGKKQYLSKMPKESQARIKVLNKNVLNPSLPTADIISVSNFSYYIFKERKELMKYFKNVYKQLPKKGLFIIDAVGGSECQEGSVETVKHKNFTYYWEQEDFNPIKNHALFHIHFKRKNEKKRQKVFTYDWRLWSLPELKDVLEEAGFPEVDIYWEMPTKSGAGSGIFKKASSGEACACWIAHIVSRK